jgi:hypothetical protein
MKIGIADYGMNVWDGGCFDYEERALQLKTIGYEGIERLTAYMPTMLFAKRHSCVDMV